MSSCLPLRSPPTSLRILPPPPSTPSLLCIYPICELRPAIALLFTQTTSVLPATLGPELTHSPVSDTVCSWSSSASERPFQKVSTTSEALLSCCTVARVTGLPLLPSLYPLAQVPLGISSPPGPSLPALPSQLPTGTPSEASLLLSPRPIPARRLLIIFMQILQGDGCTHNATVWKEVR